MERLGKLVKQLKEAVQTRDVAQVAGVEEHELEYDAQEAAVVGHAVINMLVTGSDAVKGLVEWLDMENASKGLLRSMEYQIIEMLKDHADREPKVDLEHGSEYTPDWGAYGTIVWPKQGQFKVKRGETVETEIRVEYRDEVG